MPKQEKHQAVSKKEPTAVVSVVQTPLKKELILEGDPEQQLAYAHKAAKALMTWVGQKKNPVMIRGKQYLEFGDWQILARFYGATISVEWARPIERGGKLVGYEARVNVLRNGEIIASAEGMCMMNEKRWNGADEYAVRSMAQTRTAGKALRNAFGWVAELAGYASTPAEEMPREETYDSSPVPARAKPIVVGADNEDADNAVEEEDEDEQPPVLPADWDLQNKKRIIKTIIDERVLMPLAPTKEAYERYVGENLGLELIPENFDKIIKFLKAD